MGKIFLKNFHRTIPGFGPVELDNTQKPKLAYMRTLSSRKFT